MKNVTLPLRIAYITLLTDVIVSGVDYLTLNAVNYPIYDEFAPPNAPSAYILITNQTADSMNAKSRFINNASIAVDVVTKYPANTGGKKLSEQITGAIAERVMTMSLEGVSFANFNVFSSEIVSSIDLPQETATQRIFRKVTTFRHEIEQLT